MNMGFLYKYKFLSKINEIKNEFKLIFWPNKREIIQTILMVIVVVILTCLFLWIIDAVLVYVISSILII